MTFQAHVIVVQATHSGFSLINQDNVFKVCDQPHPLLVANMINHCLSAEIDPAFGIMKNLCDLGYSATDIITTLFRVVRNYKMQEFLKLEFIKVCMLTVPFLCFAYNQGLLATACFQVWHGGVSACLL